MKFLKLFAICLSIFAVVLIGAVIYIRLADPDILVMNNRPHPSQSEPAQSEAASPKPTKVQPTPVPSPSEDLSIPTASSNLDPSTLIIGKWKAANNPKWRFEFFQDGTFIKGTYRSKHDYNEISGTYSFSNSSRLKLQYEKWTMRLESGYTNTHADYTDHVFDITIDDNKLAIPGAAELYSTSEWIRVN